VVVSVPVPGSRKRSHPVEGWLMTAALLVGVVGVVQVLPITFGSLVWMRPGSRLPSGRC